MAVQEANRPQGKRRSIFSGKLRIFTVILGLICAVVLTFLWLRGVNSDQLFKIMTVLTTMLMLVCAFLSLPILKPPEQDHTPAVAPLSQAPAPLNPPSNINPPGTQSPSISMSASGNINVTNVFGGQATTTNNDSSLQQQPIPGNPANLNAEPLPASNSTPATPFKINEPSQVDEDKLLDGLIECPAGVYSRIAVCIGLPATWRPSDKADPAEKATNLLEWAKHPDGPGIEALSTCYRKALGLGKKNEQIIGNQPPVHPPRPPALVSLRPRPTISDNPLPDELLMMADWLIDAARTSAQNIVEPFTGIGTILPVHFKRALQLEDETVQHLQDLLEILPGIPENIWNKSHSGYWQIMNKIYEVISDANKLSLLLQKGISSDRQDITKQANGLASEISRLKLYFPESAS